MKIRFVGAVGTVTGSCTLLEHNGEYFLVDCGAGQDSVADARTPLDFKPRALRSMFLTHAHLDHCGLIPALIAQGFHGRIYCTAATRDLTLNSLRDSEKLGRCPCEFIPDPEQFYCPDEHPEFTWGKYLPAADNLTVAFSRSSHILGAASVSFQFHDPKSPTGRTNICFSGDVGCNEPGHCAQALLAKRQLPDHFVSYLVLESTYGSRNRPPEAGDYTARMEALRDLIERAFYLSEQPLIIVPCFTLHRTQEFMADLHTLLATHLSADTKRAWRLRLGREEHDDRPLVEVAVESKLAWAHSTIYRRELVRVSNTGKRKPLYLNTDFAARAGVAETEVAGIMDALFEEPVGWMPKDIGELRFTCSQDHLRPGCIQFVVAGSGMCQGGRALELLRKNLGKPEVLVALMGFQAPDTPGAQLRKRVDNPDVVLDLTEWKMPADVKATIVDLGKYYSGHADQAGLVKYALHKDDPKYRYASLKRVFLNHGEQSSRLALREALLEHATTHAAISRAVEGVELPKRGDGWFDLLKNEWSVDPEIAVDGADALIASLFRKVAKLEQEITELRKTG
ncbi:MAG: MBL fold metallo-hydrolase [Opitutaceae bacterium]|jgi:metallo-beta-lactamase family protein|nr:MBL fold metallo-hydrolase [Opitutaceae bacterium]